MEERRQVAVRGDGFGDFQERLVLRGGSGHLAATGSPLPFRCRLQKPSICVVAVFDLKLITQFLEEPFECLILIRRDFERRQNTAEIRAVVPVMEEADVPAAAKCVQKLKQRAGPLGELETAEAFAFDAARVSADHVTDVKFGEFVVREIGCFITLAEKVCLDASCVFPASDAQAHKNVRALPVVQPVIEFGDYALPAK